MLVKDRVKVASLVILEMKVIALKIPNVKFVKTRK